MKKDIPFHKVEDIAIAVIPDEITEDEMWKVYLINMKPEPITNVIITSKGYGHVEGRPVETSVMRQFFETIDGRSYSLIEPIDSKLFGLSNEFWVSFVQEGVMYDKKYVFVTESIVKDNFTSIPLMDTKGVMIK